MYFRYTLYSDIKLTIYHLLFVTTLRCVQLQHQLHLEVGVIQPIPVVFQYSHSVRKQMLHGGRRWQCCVHLAEGLLDSFVEVLKSSTVSVEMLAYCFFNRHTRGCCLALFA